MSREINLLFISLEKLRMVIEDAQSKSEDAAAQAASLRGDWEQKLAEQLDDFSERLREMKMDMETTIDDGKTIWDDWKKEEEALREASDDEELGKVEAEHIQEEMEEKRLERREKE